MKRRIHKNLFYVVAGQVREFSLYYFVAIVSLVGTHYVQSLFPEYAKDLADMIGGGPVVNIYHFFILAASILVLRTASRWLFFYPARVFQRNLRVEILEELESVNPSRYRDHSSGQIFQVLYNDLDHVRTMVGFVLLQVCNVIVASLIIVPKIMAIHSSLILTLSPMFVALFIFSFVASKNKERYTLIQNYQGEVQNFIMESYIGKRTVKNYGAESSFIDVFNGWSFKELHNFFITGSIVSVARPLIPLGVGLSLLWGALVIHGQGLGASTLIMFSGLSFLFLEPLMFLSWIGIIMSRSLGAWSRVWTLTSDLRTTSSRENSIWNGEKYQVKFWNKDIAINYKDHEITAILGKTGHGKTEVIKQLADQLILKSKESISFVFQSPYLYNDTLINNVLLGRKHSKENIEKVLKLLDLFGLDYFADSDDELLNLEVGEHGTRLSGGQAKRLCIIRSLMSNASILIWDDPFSSVDVILEKEIIGKLRPILKDQNKTVILTSHRLSTAEESDSYFLLDKEVGILEKGSSKVNLKNKESKLYEYFKDQMV